MKNKIQSFLSILFLTSVLLALGLLSSVHQPKPAKAAGTQLWPSLKTVSSIPGSQYNIDWMTSHYDWIDSAPPPIGNWFKKNPNIKVDVYDHWHILNLLDDTSSTQPTYAQEWYDYASQNNLDWESGFYHLSTADTYIPQNLGNNGLSVDAKIRYVLYNNSTTSYANNAWSGNANLNLSNNNSAVYFGRLDRFDEINLDFSTVAGSGWQGAWEYWNGSSWATLTLASDTTNGCQQAGKVTFTPPTSSNWQRTKVNNQPTYWGNNGIYFIRLRTTAGSTTGPVIKQAQGRHYWIHNGTSGNTIPAWDPTNDPNHDGYAEANANSKATAHFEYESRLPHSWDWCELALNVGNPTLQHKFPEFALDRIKSMADGSLKYKGIRLDDVSGTSNINSAAKSQVLEYPGQTSAQIDTNWRNSYEQMLIYGQKILNDNGYELAGNVGWTGIDQFNQHFDYLLREDAQGAGGAARISTPGWWGNWEEYTWPQITKSWNKDNLWQWQLALYYKMGDQSKSITLTNGSATVTGVGTQWTKTVQPGSVIDLYGNSKFSEVSKVVSDTELTLTSPWNNATLTTTTSTFLTSRDKYLGLAAFLVMQNPQTSYFSEWWSYYYSADAAPYRNWTPVETLDYGAPTGIIPQDKSARGPGGAYVFQTAADPSHQATKYLVYARDYQKALALFRPITGNGSFFEDSTVTFNLPSTSDNPSGKYYKVNYDGSIDSTPITQINLMNAEGAILMKESALNQPSISKSVDKSSAASGDTLTYTISYSNPTANTYANTKIEDNIPSGTTYVAGSATDGATFDGSKIILNIGNLAASASGSIQFQVKIQ